jgi:uncharacterized protein YbaP (TraB family)
VTLTALCAAASVRVAAADQPLPMWQIDGESNRIYLLGSVHLLREQDYPLPSAIYAAYDDAEALIMELDMDDIDPARMQSLVSEMGALPAGGSLADIMGQELYAEAETLAAEINIPLQMLAGVEPWLAAITIEQLMLQRIGFDPRFGIEAHMVGKAATDRKEIVGLEELEEQLGFLDGLSLQAQRALLIQTLSEAADIAPMMDGLIRAWRSGDVAYLEENMLEEMQAYPELYAAIVVERNRRWVERIVERLDDQQDYLIIVGALHLIGEDSVPALLERRGRTARQLFQAD